MPPSQDIGDFGLDLGYSRVGITAADSFPSYIEELKARHEMYAWYIEGPSRPLPVAGPKSIMPSAKSMVAVMCDGSKESFPEKFMGKMGRLYQARCYLTPPRHRINGARRQLMRGFLVNTR